jgi:hypothetical protein
MSEQVQAREVADLTSIEGPTVCHNFPRGAAVSYCGVPRAEQEEHSPDRPVGSPESVSPFCPYCGLPRCPTCAEWSRRRARGAA